MPRLQCKKLVFLNRIRLKPFLLDFDKVNSAGGSFGSLLGTLYAKFP